SAVNVIDDGEMREKIPAVGPPNHAITGNRHVAAAIGISIHAHQWRAVIDLIGPILDRAVALQKSAAVPIARHIKPVTQLVALPFPEAIGVDAAGRANRKGVSPGAAAIAGI